MSCYRSRSWWGQVAERAVKTFAQTVIAVIVLPTGAMQSTTWVTHNALAVAGMGAIAAAVSVLTSVVQGETLGGAS